MLGSSVLEELYNDRAIFRPKFMSTSTDVVGVEYPQFIDSVIISS